MKMELKFRRTHFPRRSSGIYGHSGVWQRKSTKTSCLPGLSEAEGKCKGATQEEKRKNKKMATLASARQTRGKEADDAH